MAAICTPVPQKKISSAMQPPRPSTLDHFHAQLVAHQGHHGGRVMPSSTLSVTAGEQHAGAAPKDKAARSRRRYGRLVEFKPGRRS
jgi:hypothetical protein